MSRIPPRAAGYVFRAILTTAVLTVLACVDETALAQTGDVQWIWSAANAGDVVPKSTCYFRKTFQVDDVQSAQIEITADDRYELYVSGRKIGTHDDWHQTQSYDIKRFLTRGRNVVAVKVDNLEPGSAALIARLTVTEVGSAMVSFSTDPTWKTSLKELPGWETISFDDSQWLRAHSYGEFGTTPPWGSQVTATDGSPIGRFLLSSEFRIEQILVPEETGSLLAMTFNEWGEILASREGGPLLVCSDSDDDGIADSVRTYCESVTNCQGILSLNGHVFVVGDGPDGAALYRLSDDDADGTAENVETLVEFTGTMGEHGPHGVVLGPDGFLYVVVGNHSQPKQTPDKHSPYPMPYEGDLVQPRYEDAGGHAVGIKAPGGSIIRTDADGSFVQRFAGGLRNAYDLAFNRQGDLFTFDSDMEWDEGLPWYRPTRINHVIPGGEFGWRSGWAKWPDYYFDGLPTTLDLGRGSPTGIEVYNHDRYPVRYHNALFVCDWTRGRILAIRNEPSGGSYKATEEIFLMGRPLNVTDLAVGPDGWLYFSTGGRGTEGGVYRVVWLGKTPPKPKVSGVMQAIRQPQLQSAWSRQQIASIQAAEGDQWGPRLRTVALDAKQPSTDRARALDLMQLFGPFPSPDDLMKISKDRNAELRAKAATLMGVHVSREAGGRLIQMLHDPDATVRRKACEALASESYIAPAGPLVKLLGDPDRHTAFAAQRALERLDVSGWSDAVLTSEVTPIFIHGSGALLAVDGTPETAHQVLDRTSELLQGYLTDDEFLDLLRLVQLALSQGGLSGDDVPAFTRQIAEEYPSSDAYMNRELLRILVHLQASNIAPRIINQLTGADVPQVEKLHLAAYARFLESGWSTADKLLLLEYYDQAGTLPGGYSFPRYFEVISRDFCKILDADERSAVLDNGPEMPSAALAVLATSVDKLDDDTVVKIIELDRRIIGLDTPAAKRLRTAVIAVLSQAKQPEVMDYLRHLWTEEPERRGEIAMGLAQSPDGANWQFLVDSLKLVEGVAAQEVLVKLAQVERVPDEPEAYRQTILCGLRLGDEGGKLAAKLLEQWAGPQTGTAATSAADALAAWQVWFANAYPDEPPAVLPVAAAGSRWTFGELVGFLTSDEGRLGDAGYGAAVFEKAQCAKCHRFNGRGETIGPDLTTVGHRFQIKEIVEAVVYPSQVISDQYRSQTVTTTTGLSVTGLVRDTGDDATVVLQPNGEKVTFAKSDVDEILPSRKSAMPEGLFDRLTLDEIADLFAYLASGTRDESIVREKSVLDIKR